MALVYLSWVSPDGTASDILFDASPARQHHVTAQVTQHPVEKGSPVTDYIRPLPRTISIDGLITNTPIGPVPVRQNLVGVGVNATVSQDNPNDAGGGAGIQSEVTTQTLDLPVSFIRGGRGSIQYTGLDFLEQFDRVNNSFVSLARAILDGAIFYVSLSEGDFVNMAGTALTVTATPSAAQALQFTIEFQELRFVSTKTVAVASVRAAKKTEDTANKSPTAANPAQAKALQSTLSALVVGPDAP